ncbi:MAG: Dam family site-specific DNA-(adenine-N6)-methyltransferase [Firmicutes bacterium]|nr:Dam family site-specific DNA-(adenine-N6)-methyltransferase [Bacillota bacterium]
MQSDLKAKLNPPLKWAGGKRWLVPQLQPFWERYLERRLVEPFCGGLAVSLGLAPDKALLNDVNPHLINFYRWLQKGFVVSIEMINDKGVYYANRSRFNELISEGDIASQEAAELFYFLNRTGYNGLCRFNKKGKFNVPFGRYKRINYAQDFLAYRPLLENWEFRCGDFGSLQLQPNDFVYADPPYDVEFTQYAQGGFAWEDQVRLAHWLSQHPGPVVASNQATGRIIELYGDLGFLLITLEGPRRISCTGDRTPAKEVLALKGVEGAKKILENF